MKWPFPGLSRRLELVIFDNHSSARDSKHAAQDAVHHKVVGVVGAVWSTHSLAIGPVLQKNHIPMISPGSTAPEVTQTGNYLFRTCSTDDFHGDPIKKGAGILKFVQGKWVF